MDTPQVVVPDLPPGILWNVFLCYKSTDGELAKIYQQQMKSAGFRVMNYEDDFTPGSALPVEMVTKMDQCMRMVVLCTPNYLKCEGGAAPQYEALQGVKKMIDEKERFVILLRHNVPRQDIPKFLRWVPILDTAHEQFSTNLLRCIADASPLQFSLQGNDVGFGMAYAYFYSYLNIICPPQPGEDDTEQPDLEARIRQLKDKPGNEGIVLPNKIYIIVPESGKLPVSISNVDPRFKDEDKFNVVVYRGGSKRPYWNTIRSIESNGKKNKVLVEYATALQPLADMEADPSANFTADDRLLQLQVFYRTLNSILAPWRYGRMVELVHFDDMAIKIGDEILGRITQK